VVVASKYLYHAVTIQRALTTLQFRCFTTQDVIGVQLGGALKNPLAIGAGVIEGMGLYVCLFFLSSCFLLIHSYF
jgi:glycerol-3-phosphate dehydrogenase